MERMEEDCNKLAKVVKFGCDTFKDFRNLLDSFSGKKSFVIFRFGFWVMLLNQEPSFDFSTSFFFGLSFQNDRMAVDMAFELRKTNVACVSLWPGAVMTENIHDIIHSQSKNEMVRKANFLSFRTYGVLSKFLSESYYLLPCCGHCGSFSGMKWTVWLKRTLPAEMSQ